MTGQSPGRLQTTTCPECRSPAEVVGRHVLDSTDGPVEHARVRCVRLHVFNLPVAMLVIDDRSQAAPRRLARRADATRVPRT